MSDFNPDEYLAEKNGFDPDEYLSNDQPKENMFNSAIRKSAAGLSGGFSDEIAGGIEAAGRAIGVSGAGGPLSEIGLDDDGPTLDWNVLRDAYNKAKLKERNILKKDSKDNPGVSAVAEIGGAIASPINKIAKGMSAAKGGLALGGIMGLGNSEADDLQGMAVDTATGAALGGAIGKGVDVASPYIQKGAEKLSGGLKSTAERLAARSLGAERGSIKKLGQEKVQDLGRYALDEGLLTPLSSTDDIIERNLAKQAQGASKMNEVYGAIDDAGKSTFNPLNAASKVDEQIGGFYRSPINKGETAQLENTLESMLMRGDKNIPLAEAQKLKQELGKVANWKNNVVVSEKEKMAREAYGIVSSQIDEAVETGAKEIGSDGLLETLKQGKKLFGNSKGAEELLTNKLAREQGNKLVGLTDTIATGTAATAAGPMGLMAYPAKKVLESYGPQSSALAFDKISKSLMKSPKMVELYQKNPNAFQSLVNKFQQSMELMPRAAVAPDNSSDLQKPPTDKNELIKKTEGSKYSKVLQDAAAKGDQSFNAAHYVLSTRDPEYRKQMGLDQ